jgi:hypothetical protein
MSKFMIILRKHHNIDRGRGTTSWRKPTYEEKQIRFIKTLRRRKAEPRGRDQTWNVIKLVKKIEDLIYLQYLIRNDCDYFLHWYFPQWCLAKQDELFLIRYTWWRKYKENAIEHFKEWIGRIYARFIRFRDVYWSGVYRTLQRYYSPSRILYKDYFRYITLFVREQTHVYSYRLTWLLKDLIISFFGFYKSKMAENSWWPWLKKQQLKKKFGEKKPEDYIFEWKLLELKREKVYNTRRDQRLNQWRKGKIPPLKGKQKLVNRWLKKREKKVVQKHNFPRIDKHPDIPFKHI